MRDVRGLLDFDRQLPPTMPLDTAERLYLDRQVTLARAIFVALALVDLIEISVAGSRTAGAIFLGVYLLLALAVLGYERLSSETNVTIPLIADCVALAVFLAGRDPDEVPAILQRYENFRRVRTDVIQAEARKTGLRYDSKYENLEQRDREIAKSGPFRKTLYDYDVEKAAIEYVTAA